MRRTNWREIVVECRSSGMTAKDWCKERDINYNMYSNWATKYNREERDKSSEAQQWVEVTPIGDVQNQEEIKLTCGKWTIAVNTDFDPSFLTKVLKIVSSIC